jgi:hypothetical protein
MRRTGGASLRRLELILHCVRDSDMFDPILDPLR